jgi:nucleotide sugar dehydrogenase
MSKIAIMGAGVVGQATGKGFIKSGHRVNFVDTNVNVLGNLSAERYEVSSLDDFDKLDNEITILCLPTPSKYGMVDLSHIESVLPSLGRKLSLINNYHLVVFRSTVPPGTTENFILKLEIISNKKAGKDFGVCFNPEFLREASSENDFLHPWSIVIGAHDQRSGNKLLHLYENIIHTNNTPVIITDLKTAEMIKYTQNLYNTAKISFTNEIWMVCRKLGINSDIVMEAVAQSAEGMWNPRYGIHGGYAYGGNCLPKDSECFLTFARQALELEMPMLESIIKINNSFEKPHGK